jgi:alpha-galactosidase
MNEQGRSSPGSRIIFINQQKGHAMPAKKIVCLGAGSLYFPWALIDLASVRDLEGSEIVFYDLDAEKAQLMTGLASRIFGQLGVNYRVRTAKRLADAVDGADFAVSSIGGSGAEITPNVYGSYYAYMDKHISAKHGVQQVVGDTCGPAGMMMALRSIPAHIAICREMEKRCPRAIMISHSNPMAALCRAIHKYTSISMIGLCHGVQGGIGYAAEVLNLPIEELECCWVGTNHYYWFTALRHKGKDVYPELRRKMARRSPSPGKILSAELSRIYGYHIVYPSDDHIIEFYPFLTQVAGGQKNIPYGMAAAAKTHGYDEGKPRVARHVAFTGSHAKFITQYKKILDATQIPDKAEPSSALRGEGLARMISAIACGRREWCIANVANQGAIANLPFSGEIETEVVTDSTGVKPIVQKEAPLILKGMLEKRFVWQELIADAGVKGDRQAALQALLVDEMAIWPDKAGKMLDELLAASRDLLPQFYK